LQPTKGAIVALQWQTGMHGFEQSKGRREMVDAPAGAMPARVTVAARH